MVRPNLLITKYLPCANRGLRVIFRVKIIKWFRMKVIWLRGYLVLLQYHRAGYPKVRWVAYPCTETHRQCLIVLVCAIVCGFVENWACDHKIHRPCPACDPVYRRRPTALILDPMRGVWVTVACVCVQVLGYQTDWLSVYLWVQTVETTVGFHGATPVRAGNRLFVVARHGPAMAKDRSQRHWVGKRRCGGCV